MGELMNNKYIKIAMLAASFVLIGCGGETKKSFYDDGTIEYIAEYNSESQLDGEYKSYYSNGQIEELKHYSDGLLDGELIEYSSRGVILKRKNC